MVNTALKFTGLEAEVGGETYRTGDQLTLNRNEVKMLKLYALADTAEGETRIQLDPADVKWTVYGERNVISLEETGGDGIILTSVTPGETALGYSYGGAEQSGDAKLSFGMEDYILIQVSSAGAPAAPTGITGRKTSGRGAANGALRGTTTDMEYDVDENFPNPQPCGDGTTGGLKAGVYYVRYKANGETPASEAAIVVIGEGTGGWVDDETSPDDGLVHIADQSNGHGEIILSADAVEPGSSVTVTIRPEEGYLLDEIRINGEVVPLHGKFTLKELNENTVIEVDFVPRPTEEAWVNPFADVLESDWFYDDVSYACRSRWMNGVADDAFDPRMPLTRATFVTVLYRFDLMPESVGESFTDVPEGTWYTEPVAWASEAKIVNGVGNDEFAPNQSITREQMATMLYRYMNYCGYDVSAKDDADLSAFEDAGSISAYAEEAMRWAVGCGLFRGRSDTELAPRGTATRAEVATVFRRLETLVKTAPAAAEA